MAIDISIPKGTLLYRQGELNHYAHFVTSGLASVVVQMRNGDASEAAFVGSEGVAASMQLLGTAKPPTTCMAQLDMTALKISLSNLATLFKDSETIRRRLLEYIQQECYTLSQVSGCNSLHQAPARLARWLLMAQDRTGSSTMRFTQEFLGHMLGLRRTTVTAIACAFETAGTIQYSRGTLTILDRRPLETQACECYPILSALQRNLYQQP